MKWLRRAYLIVSAVCALVIAVTPFRSPVALGAFLVVAIGAPVIEFVAVRKFPQKLPKRWYLWVLNHSSLAVSFAIGTFLRVNNPDVSEQEIARQSTTLGLLGFVSLISALACWTFVVRYRLPRLSLTVALDWAIGVLGASLVIMTVTGGSTAARSPLADILFSLLIPATGFGLTSAVVRLFRSPHNRLPSLWWLTAANSIGIATQVITGFGWDTRTLEHAMDIAFLAMMACFGLGVTHVTSPQLMEPLPVRGERESPSVSRMLLLGFAVLTIPLSAVYRSYDLHGSIDWPWSVGSVALLLVVGSRVTFAISGQAKAERSLRRTVLEQAAVAELSQRAAQRPNQRELMQEATNLVVRTLGCETAVVVELSVERGTSHTSNPVPHAWRIGVASGKTMFDSDFSDVAFLTGVLHEGHRSGVVPASGGQQSAVGVLIGELEDPIGVLVALGPSSWQPDGGTTNFLQAFAYVTGLAIRQEHIEHQLEQSRKLESVGRLAAGVAHEINTPIQFIGDNARFLKEATAALVEAGSEKSDSEIAFYREEAPLAASQVLEGVERVAGIVHAMRAFSNVNASKVVEADLNEALKHALVVAGSELRGTARVEVDFDDLPRVECRVGEVNQVFLNLIVNAADAVRDQHGDSGEEGVIRVATRHQGKFVVISISDNGGGIPEAIRHKIFDQFFTTKDVGDGTGQGLAIARTIIRAHEGDITFVSSSSGTEFQVKLPLVAPRRQKSPSAVELATP